MSIIISGQPASYYSFGNGILGLNGYSIQAQPPVPATTAYELTLENDGHGTVSASTLSGFPGDSATLSTTPSTDYEFSGYSVTGGTIDGNTFTYGNQDATAKAWFKQSIVYLTLQNDGHGTLTATSLTGRPGDTVTLTPTYNTYYRFSAYQVTGGTINGNTYTFGTAMNQTAKANFKVNAFTASGNWEKGSDVQSIGSGSKTVAAKYALKTYATSNTPTAWWATSNRWNVSTTVSGYKITLNPKMYFTLKNQGNLSAQASACTLVGTTKTNIQTHSNSNWTYSPSFTSNTTGVNYRISAYIYANGQGRYQASAKYIATGTTGTWTATGYAP